MADISPVGTPPAGGSQAEAGPKDSPLFIGAAEKIFQVLHAFDGSGRQMPLSEIAKRSGLGRSAAQRVVYTLEVLGYLRRVHNSRDYSLTGRFLQFSYDYLSVHEVLQKAAPYLIGLSDTLGETVNLQELDGTEVVYIARYPGRRVMNLDFMVGSRIPALFTASGTAMLARLPEAMRERVIQGTEMRAITPRTCTDPQRLRERLQRAAEAGYACVAGETVLGDIAVACPILNEHGLPVAAVNISVPETRWTRERAEQELVPHVVMAATAISTRKF
ncbi:MULTISPECIES: IclR family transcriptional regulator [unclassified Pseudomonas]|uniref:IclR family transcriptional regulator n=1 Tax=unclassified Pseudomonas TaxID=196821 RepID=UPI000BC9735C|nr:MULTISPECIES: IclR family transcriptional regulator C-terminal domain-containing protein [unclassified Pseudomonas]PVZ19678.1 IclR family transcriptional regulator [Pseudomonas sp. URIL14HWK12:I12]PVZ22737.1 IclR family transcriptional regulator [Pseudomonas sp. URIL14HWK12:I10]PVZ37633.1 IclR family transcriptional regulator [Pseudomonas sp. URIL14HWK12:I11]SNZ15314.1 transcriptional regulator, IclR family [Pseudomonas sp. URIL14HWK12:I9]